MTEVTCAVIIKGSKILIAQRSEVMKHPLKWEFPGGKVKYGESPENCIKREISEELNVEINMDRILPPVYHDYGSDRIKLLPFICTLKSGEILLKEHKSFAWIEKNEMDNYDLLEADIEVINTIHGL